jgi:uncharacterized protein YfaS (alpha-2-macroglobulin family)
MNRLFSLFLLVFLCFSSSAQFFTITEYPPISAGTKFQNYDWKTVDMAIVDGTPRLALERIGTVQQQAIKEGNVREFWRTCVRFTELIDKALYEKEEVEKMIWNFSQKVDSLIFPMDAILHSFLAKWVRHFRDYSLLSYDDESLVWKIKDTVTQLNYEKTGELIQFHLEKSLERAQELMKLGTADYFPYGAEKENSRTEYGPDKREQPTLFDVFCLQAMNGYRSKKEEFVDLLYLKDTDQLLLAKGFSDAQNKDFVLFYHLEKLNWVNERYAAYALLIEKRLSVAKSTYGYSFKAKINIDSVLQESYQWFEKKLIFDDNSSRFSLHLAEDLSLKADRYHWKKNVTPIKYHILALEKIHQSLTTFPKSPFQEQLIKLEKKIKGEQLDFSFKSSILPREPLLMNVHYANINQACLSVYKVEEKKKEGNNTNPLKNYSLKKMETKMLSFTNDSLYLLHDKDFIIEPLKETGEYLFLITPRADQVESIFLRDTLPENIPFAYQLVKSSGLHVATKQRNGSHYFLVTQALTGQPMEGAKIELNVQHYNKGKSVINHVATLTTDQEGRAKFGGTTSYHYIVIWKEDSITGSVYHGYRYDDQEDTKINLFTDRAIYRPGQTGHYKFIVGKLSEDSYHAVANHSVEIELQDQNGKILYSEEKRTSSFGSGSGTFTLPMSGFLLGDIHVMLNGSYFESIRVEEYKRPTFEVIFDTIRTQYAVGDSIKMTGKVRAFSGYPIQGAKVLVAIDQHTYKFSSNTPTGEAILLETTTDSGGVFRIDFLAKETADCFGIGYSVKVSVLASSGETQEGREYLYVGKQRFNIQTNLGSELLSNGRNTPKIWIRNKQGVEQKEVPVHYVLEKIDQEKWHPYSWMEAEHKDFTTSQFEEKFPLVSYFREQKREASSSVKGITSSGDLMDLDLLTGKRAGRYQLTLQATDETGAKISATKLFNYISVDSKKKQHKSEFWISSPPSVAAVGDTLSILLGSSYKKCYVFLERANEKGDVEGKWLKVKGRAKVNYTVKEADKGVLVFNFLTVYRGKFFQQEVRISVPKEDKTLNIHLQTKRESLTPGGKETWTLTIKDAEEKTPASELLVAMYDASLDQFTHHGWDNSFHHQRYVEMYWNDNSPFFLILQRNRWKRAGFYSYYGNLRTDDYRARNFKSAAYKNGGDEVLEFAEDSTEESNSISKSYAFSSTILDAIVTEKSADSEQEAVPAKPVGSPRTNFNETAFFYPKIYADSTGEYRFEFTLPDALTQWRFMSLAHTKDLKSGYTESFFEAKKELMVEPNEPRFFREGDTFVFTSRVVNRTDKSQTVSVRLKMKDPNTEKEVSTFFGSLSEQKIVLPPNGAEVVGWDLQIPVGKLSLVSYLLEAEGEAFSDAEQKTIPILSNRMLISESKPFVKTSAGEQTFTLEKIAELSPSAEKIALSLELQAQPLWTTLMSLPYLMEFPYECSEQTFARFFGNALAQKILQDNPELERVITTWKSTDPRAYLSELEKNPELKAIILAETPWVMDAHNEAKQRHRLALLFDENTLSFNTTAAWGKLKEMQSDDGGWGWFGGESNRYITQHVVTGFGLLKQMGVVFDAAVAKRALDFLDGKFLEDYRRIKKEDVEKLEGLTDLHLHWLVARSYFQSNSSVASLYYAKSLQKNWKNFNLHSQALAGMVAHRNGDKEFAEKIKNSIVDRATRRAGLGMYWNENKNGYFWNQSTVETQSALIAFFTEVGNMDKEIKAMQLWLLQQKRSNAWETTKATTLACHALLVNREALQSQMEQVVHVRLGDGTDLGTLQKDSGTTFRWTGSDITVGKGTVSVHTKNDQVVFGAIHLQYLEDMDKIEKSTGDIRLERHYYYSKEGQEVEIVPGSVVSLGTKILVKLTVTSNRAMEFVHLKDPKASGFEARESLSGYRYATVPYYQMSKDASTEFFIDFLPKGSHSFQYDGFVSGKGSMTTGAAIVECMYAPSFRANSSGARIQVE